MTTPPLPRVVGKYRIETLLGRGGMGEVYRAYDTALDRTVALKMIRPEGDEPLAVERFRREARAAGRLKHPAIVTIHDLGEWEGALFLTMEYLEGKSLASALKAGSLSLDDKLRALIQILDALDYAHANAVVHRDIKPANVHLLPDGSIKILDFGVARILTSDPVTRTGSIVGTPHYMAPEQLRGEHCDRRADIYSAGVLAYELLTLRRPFDGESLTEVILKVLSQPPAPMSGECLQELPDLQRIVSQAIEKEPARRYATAGEMAAELRAALSGRGTVPAPAVGEPVPPDPVAEMAPASAASRAVERPAPRPRARRSEAHVAGGVVAVIIVVFGGWGLFSVWSGGSGAPVVHEAGAVSPSGRPAPERPPDAVAEQASPAAPTHSPREVPVQTKPGSVCVEALRADSDNRTLAARVREGLRARGAQLVGSCSGAATVVRVSLQVSLRAAPFGETSARTADYAGVIEIQRQGESVPRRFDVDGHTMEFGDTAARAAALHAAGEQVAEKLRGQSW